MRCIYAELLCETLNTYKSNVGYCLGDDNIVASIVDNLIKIISNFPTADVREVVRGEWKPSRFKTLQEDGWCECSVCGVGNKLYDRGVRKSDVPYIDGKPYELKRIANYCPNCGADMRGK